MPKSKGAANAEAKPAASGNNNLFAYISFFVAALSLVASMYQGYLNTRYVELIQTSVARAETARTCKDLIDAYFQIKFKTATLAVTAEREKGGNTAAVIAAENDAANSASRFAALGTYLANFQGEMKRAQYTALSQELNRLVTVARTAGAGVVDKQFDKADALFTEMNDDCVRSANTRM